MRDILPAIYPDDGIYTTTDMQYKRFNMVPYLLNSQELALSVRNEFLIVANTPSASTDRGRGVIQFSDNNNLYLTETDYVHGGGSQDLTATTAPGWAGNLGFNEEFIASFARHNIAGVSNLVIQNAGHASTHASANHGNIWYVADSSSDPAGVADANSPGNNGVSMCRGVVSLDGYVFVCDINGKIHNSNLNDITTWTAADFLTAESETDYAVYIGKHHNNIVYIGTRSIEFFYNAGNPTGSPLAKRQDVSYSIGSYYPNAVVEAGDIIYFIGTSQTGITKIYKLENFQLTPISNPTINEILMQDSTAGTDPDITALDSLKHSRYMCIMPMNAIGNGLLVTIENATNRSRSWYWNELTNVWCAWGLATSQTYFGGMPSGGWTYALPVVSYYGGNPKGTIARYQFTNGAVCEFSGATNSALKDLGVASVLLPPTASFPIWDAGTDRKKKINAVRILTASSGTTDASFNPITAGLKWRDLDKAYTNDMDTIAHYTSPRNVNINIDGAVVRRCGTTRRRKFLIEMAANKGAGALIKGLEIDYEIVGE